MLRKTLLATAIPLAFYGASAQADLTVSTAATQNMNCQNGTCVPTATKAVLNASDLENYLSEFGNVRVTTTGSGVEAENIIVHSAFAAPDSTSLTLQAHKAITVNAAVSIGSGAAELELQSDKGGKLGTLSFGTRGHVAFGSLSDVFGINGRIFTLVGSVQELASAVAAHSSGHYALANSYDATQDGTYSTSPVSTPFTGTFEGLGNTISHVQVHNTTSDAGGLFDLTGQGSLVRNFGLVNVRVRSHREAGGLGVTNEGTIFRCHVSGVVLGEERADAGGVVATNDGTGSISDSYSTASVSGRKDMSIGGLVGRDDGSISASFATGSVTQSVHGIHGELGGLVGYAAYKAPGLITNSYATGAVTGYGSEIGGFIGTNYFPNGKITNASITASYSTGPVTGSSVAAGGFIGYNASTNTTAHDYWNTTTSGTNVGVGGGDTTGITGLTTEQLQSGLPAGFDSKIWAEDPNINNGFPYLINNPPPK